jgi:hypothetical protein
MGVAPVYGLAIDRDLRPDRVQVASDKTIHKAGCETPGRVHGAQPEWRERDEVSGRPFQSDITFSGLLDR